MAWDAVPGDNRTEHVITRYTVWRAIEPTAVELSSFAPGSFIARISDLAPAAKKDIVRLELAGSLKYYWKLISSIDAYYLEGYSEVVPTLFDSTAVCTEYHYVQIIAHTSDPYTFWVSPPDSGRSVDNLAPEEPLMPRRRAELLAGGSHAHVEAECRGGSRALRGVPGHERELRARPGQPHRIAAGYDRVRRRMALEQRILLQSLGGGHARE